jgi:hypothetical protein
MGEVKILIAETRNVYLRRIVVLLAGSVIAAINVCVPGATGVPVSCPEELSDKPSTDVVSPKNVQVGPPSMPIVASE